MKKINKLGKEKILLYFNIFGIIISVLFYIFLDYNFDNKFLLLATPLLSFVIFLLSIFFRKHYVLSLILTIFAYLIFIAFVSCFFYVVSHFTFNMPPMNEL